MSTRLATYYVAVVPTTAGIQGQLYREMSPEVSKAAQKAGKVAGDSLGREMARGVKSSLGAVSTLGQDLRKAVQPGIDAIGRFRDGLNDSKAAASSFTGTMGTLGGQVRKALDAGAKHVHGFTAGFRDSQAAASALTGVLGTLGGATSKALSPALNLGRNYVAGFRDSQAAASSFTGTMGTLGGVTRRAWDAAGKGAAAARGAFQSVAPVVTGAFTQISTMAGGIGSAFSGFGSTVSGAFAGVRAAVDETRASLTTLTSAAMTAGAAIVGVIGGIAIKGGIDRALNIEDAQAKLRGLGHDATAVDSIMENALASVKGTSFGLDEAATVAAQAVASGIEPGEALQGVLTTVANSAAASNVSMSEMGSVFGKVMATNKAYNDSLQQLSDRGIPIYQALADQMGVSTDEVSKLAAKGKIDFETFEAAAASAVGTVASEMGNTTRGQIKNFFASLSRGGAMVVNAVLPAFKTVVVGATELSDAIQERVGPAIEGTGRVVTAFMGSFNGVEGFMAFRTTLEDVGLSAEHGLGYALIEARGSILAFGAAFRSTGDDITSSGLPGVFERLGLLARDTFQAIRDGIQAIPTPLLAGLGAVLASAAGALAWAAVAAGPLGKVFGAIARVVGPLLPTLGGLARVVMALVSPWSLLIGVVVAAVVQSEDLRDKFRGLFDAVIELVSGVGSGLAPMLQGLAGQVLPVVVDVFGAVVDVVAAVLGLLVDLAIVLVQNLGPVLESVGAVVIPVLVAAFKVIGWVVTTIIAPALLWLIDVLAKILPPIVEAAATVIKFVFDGIVWVVGHLVSFWQTTAQPALETGFRIIGDAAMWLWESAILPAWNGIQAAIGFVVNWFKNDSGPALSGALSWLGGVFTWLHQSIVYPVWQGILFVITLVAAVLLTIWDGIKWVLVNVLGPAFVWFYEAVIKPVWNGIQTLISWAWNSVILPIFNGIKWVLENVLAPAFTWLLNDVIRPVWNGIQAAISWAWNVVILPVFNALRGFIAGVLVPTFVWLRDTVSRVWTSIQTAIAISWAFIRDSVFRPLRNFVVDTLGGAFRWFRDSLIIPVWDGVRDKLNDGWGFIRDKVFNPLKTTITETIPNAFKSGVDSVKRYWDKLKDIVKTPVGWVLDKVVQNGIVKHFNNVGSKLGLDVKLPNVWPIPGWDTGGYTGPGGKYEPAGIVHRDEFVIRKESRRAIESAAPGFMDGLNRHGASALRSIVGYATGGRVRPVQGVVSSGYGNRAGGFHDAIDFAAPTGTPVVAAEAGTVRKASWSAYGGGNEVQLAHAGGLVTWYSHMSKILTKVGAAVSAGDRIGRVGSTGNSTGPHLHFAVYQGDWPNHRNPTQFLGGALQGDGTGGGGLFNWAVEMFKKAVDLDGLMDRLPGAGFAKDVAVGVGKKLFDGAVDKLLSWIPGDNVGGAPGGGYANGGRVQVFDGGGWLRKTTDPMLIQHRDDKPDAVLTNQEWENVSTIVDAVGAGMTGGENHLHIHGQQFDQDALIRRGVEKMAFEMKKVGV